MKKSDAAKLAQEVVLEMVKAGVLPAPGGEAKKRGEYLAEIITSAHASLLTYYESVQTD